MSLSSNYSASLFLFVPNPKCYGLFKLLFFLMYPLSRVCVWGNAVELYEVMMSRHVLSL